ncbi:MAG: PLDc N-terminal domain-containing protein, partial [Lachnospiraceae bacterium]
MKSTTVEGRAKTKNGVTRLVFSVICILLEVIFIILMFTKLNRYAEAVNLLTRVVGVIVILNMYASPVTSTIKVPWILLILMFPIMGLGLYLLVGLNGGTEKMRRRYQKIDEQLLPLLPENRKIQEKLQQKIPKAGNISSYIHRNAAYPVYQNTDVTYFDEAAKGLEAQLQDLAKAEQFIFMEYHAIEDAEAWHRIQQVLEDRVKAGVEV